MKNVVFNRAGIDIVLHIQPRYIIHNNPRSYWYFWYLQYSVQGLPQVLHIRNRQNLRKNKLNWKSNSHKRKRLEALFIRKLASQSMGLDDFTSSIVSKAFSRLLDLDPPPEAWFTLSLYHYIIFQAFSLWLHYDIISFLIVAPFLFIPLCGNVCERESIDVFVCVYI